MLTIYHNPRCQKSREGLEILKNSGKEFKIREYLKDPLSEKELEQLLKKLNMNAEELVRKNETIWKKNYKGKDFSNKEILSALAKHPKLMERPIVEVNNEAVIGRPSSAIKEII